MIILIFLFKRNSDKFKIKVIKKPYASKYGLSKFKIVECTYLDDGIKIGVTLSLSVWSVRWAPSV